MPFYKLTEEEKKSYAKKYLENLEYWLRRVIDQQLVESYGNDYLNYQTSSGQFLIKKEVRDKILLRYNKYSDRFQRQIDASLLEHLIYLISKENLYQDHFKSFFETNFIFGRIHLKKTLEQLSEIRNRVYHINPISVRQLEKTVCYSNDIIESIKQQYSKMNLERSFNVPTILSYSDSLGQHFLRDNIHWATNCLIIDNKDLEIYCNDTLSMQIEIDPSYTEEEYDISWKFNNRDLGTNKTAQIDFGKEDVGDFKTVTVKITSKNEWHKLNGCDDCLVIQLRILPPI